ncbi:MAG: hypothetical protein J0L92_29035 [Deltaproteobacteria bacterium]|nr:hypothetical protein [Deltaproteobacteria bacterium]
MLRLRSPLLAIVLLLVTTEVARAQEGSAYDRAIAAYLEADFELSRASAEEALEDGATSLAVAARAHLLLALLAQVERADRTVVTAQIEDAVALDLNVRAPEGSPRVFLERLEEARATARSTPRTLVIERDTSGGARASASGLPLRLLHHLSLVCGGASATTNGSTEVSLPRATGPCEATAFDARGRVLVRATQASDAAPRGADPIASPSDDTPFIVLGVVGAVLVIGGAITLGVVLVGPSGDATLGAPRIPEWSR